MPPAGDADELDRRGLPLLDHTASSVARRIRLAREGQGEALTQLLEAHRNDLRLIASTCLERPPRGEADPSGVAQERSLGDVVVRRLWTRAVRRLGDQLGKEDR